MDVKQPFNDEIKKKQNAVEELEERITEVRDYMEENLSGSSKSDLLYEYFDDLKAEINNMNDELDNPRFLSAEDMR